MKARQLHEARIDPPARAREARRHLGDQVALEPLDRLAHGQLVDLGRVDARVDRAGHQRHAARLAGVLGLGHDGGGGQHLHAGLAHRDHVRAGTHLLEEADQVLDVVVEAEAAVRRCRRRGHCANRLCRRRARAASSAPGCAAEWQSARTAAPPPARAAGPVSTSFRKRSSVPKGVDITASSVTATSRLPTRTRVDAVGRAARASGRRARSARRRP